MRFIPGPDLPDRRQDRRPRRHPGRLRDRPRHVPDARDRPGRDGRPPQGHRGHRAALRRRHREGRRADQGPRPDQEAPGHRRHQGPHRPWPTAPRLVIEVKNGFHPEALLEQLYRQTPMEDSFGINAVGLVDGQPRTLGLKELLEVFLEHRFDVVRRRSQFRRDKKAERLHLVDGLLIAILDIDEVIQVIRTSDDAGAAQGAADHGLRPVRGPGRLHPRHAAAPAHPLLPDRAREGAGGAASRRSRSSTRSSATTTLLRKVVSDELPRSPRPTARRAAPCCSSPPAPRLAATAATLEVADDPCFALLSSTGLLARTSGRRARRRGRRPRQPRRGRLRGAAPPPAARSAC